jgi:hypothetical protein
LPNLHNYWDSPHVAPVPKQDLVFQRQMSLSSPFCVQ